MIYFTETVKVFWIHLHQQLFLYEKEHISDEAETGMKDSHFL